MGRFFFRRELYCQGKDYSEYLVNAIYAMRLPVPFHTNQTEPSKTHPKALFPKRSENAANMRSKKLPWNDAEEVM